MKKNYIILLAFLIVGTLKICAQVPNPSFENWTSLAGIEEPMGWETTNQIEDLLMLPLSVTKSTDKYTGTFAMQLKSSNDTIISVIGGPFPHNQRSAQLDFYNKFTFGGDTARISVLLTNNSGTTIVGSRIFPLYSNTPTYTLTSVPINYVSTDVPTEAVIIITMGKLRNFSSNTGNSILTVDDFAFVGTTGIEDYASNSSKLSVIHSLDEGVYNVIYEGSANKNKITLKVFDITGKLIKQVVEESTQNLYSTSIDLSENASGIYLVQMNCNGSNSTQKIIKP